MDNVRVFAPPLGMPLLDGDSPDEENQERRRGGGGLTLNDALLLTGLLLLPAGGRRSDEGLVVEAVSIDLLCEPPATGPLCRVLSEVLKETPRLNPGRMAVDQSL